MAEKCQAREVHRIKQNAAGAWFSYFQWPNHLGARVWAHGDDLRYTAAVIGTVLCATFRPRYGVPPGTFLSPCSSSRARRLALAGLLRHASCWNTVDFPGTLRSFGNPWEISGSGYAIGRVGSGDRHGSVRHNGAGAAIPPVMRNIVPVLQKPFPSSSPEAFRRRKPAPPWFGPVFPAESAGGEAAWLPQVPMRAVRARWLGAWHRRSPIAASPSFPPSYA